VRGDTIWWNWDGDAFSIDPKRFTEKSPRKQCRGVNFTRSLYRWGFKRIADQCFPNNTRVYRHNMDMFQRSKPDLLQKVKTGKKVEVSSRKHLQVADNAPTYRRGEDSSPPISSRHGLPQSNPWDEQLSQQSSCASEGTPLLSLRDAHILPSRLVASRAVANHQHQVYPFRPVADLLAEHRLHRLREEQAEVRLLEAQKEMYAAESNLHLLQAKKE
jgi:hypothetical protein